MNAASSSEGARAPFANEKQLSAARLLLSPPATITCSAPPTRRPFSPQSDLHRSGRKHTSSVRVPSRSSASVIGCVTADSSSFVLPLRHASGRQSPGHSRQSLSHEAEAASRLISTNSHRLEPLLPTTILSQPLALLSPHRLDLSSPLPLRFHVTSLSSCRL